jgi:hypothetical protein
VASKRPKLKLKFKLIVVGLIVIAALLLGLYLITHPSSKVISPIPFRISQSVDFPVYYPINQKLPAGYSLQTNSISSNNQAVLYAVSGPHGQNLSFSVQRKPAASSIQNFYTQHLPLHTTLNTAVGLATIGAIGSQAIVSLPTTGNAWVIITAPANINQPILDQIIKSLTAP